MFAAATAHDSCHLGLRRVKTQPRGPDSGPLTQILLMQVPKANRGKGIAKGEGPELRRDGPRKK
jgi:hypothetical protein